MCVHARNSTHFDKIITLQMMRLACSDCDVFTFTYNSVGVNFHGAREMSQFSFEEIKQKCLVIISC